MSLAVPRRTCRGPAGRGRSWPGPFARRGRRHRGRWPPPRGGAAGEARKAGDEAVGHEDDDEDEDGAEDEVPALDVGAGYVLDHDDKAGAHHRTEKGAGASGDHHEARLGGGREGHRLWADELMVDEV